VKRAQAALALLERIDPLSMDFTCPGMTDDDFVDWAQSIAEDAIRESLAAAEREIAAAVKLAPLVHPPLGEPVIHGERIADCPVCGGAILGNGEDLGCARCDARIHSECYWGRVVALTERQDYVRFINGGPDDYEGPPIVCAQCRVKGNPA
jgi:hypothetical protein